MPDKLEFTFLLLLFPLQYFFSFASWKTHQEEFLLLCFFFLFFVQNAGAIYCSAHQHPVQMQLLNLMGQIHAILAKNVSVVVEKSAFMLLDFSNKWFFFFNSFRKKIPNKLNTIVLLADRCRCTGMSTYTCYICLSSSPCSQGQCGSTSSTSVSLDWVVSSSGDAHCHRSQRNLEKIVKLKPAVPKKRPGAVMPPSRLPFAE